MRDTLDRATSVELSCETLAPLTFAFRFRAMASPCEVCIDGLAHTRATLAAEKVANEVARIEAKYSRYRNDSVVARINANAGGRAIPVDEETLALLQFAQSLHRESDGLFDITSGILRRVWSFRDERIPDASELAQLLPWIDATQIQIDGDSVRLAHPQMEIDFGGFGKEYAADRAAALLEMDQVRHAFVNLGGDLRVVGAKANGEPWSIGIAHPRREGETIASILLSQGALATSGDYERFFERDGKRYCHILNPKTGWPVQHWQSISTIAPICTAAGALATIAMLKGESALEFLDAQQCAYFAIRADGAQFAKSINSITA